jgi:hypothetical protein
METYEVNDILALPTPTGTFLHIIDATDEDYIYFREVSLYEEETNGAGNNPYKILYTRPDTTLVCDSGYAKQKHRLTVWGYLDVDDKVVKHG